jgi:hypothetical protein
MHYECRIRLNSQQLKLIFVYSIIGGNANAVNQNSGGSYDVGLWWDFIHFEFTLEIFIPIGKLTL